MCDKVDIFRKLNKTAKCLFCWFANNYKKVHTDKYHFQLSSKSQRLLCPASDYLLKVNNRNTKTRCEICSKSTIRTPE